MILLLLLPLLAWILCYAVMRSRLPGWRFGFLGASVLWGSAATVITEALSIFSALTPPLLALAWGGVALGALSLVIRSRRPEMPSLPAEIALTEKLLWVPIAVVLAGTLVTALLSAPNNWDSMTYHMSRVVHWIQNGSVAHFPTNTLRQLELNPWAEYAILHSMLLSAGDHAANLVQWFSMAGCAVGVSLMASLFGAGRLGQLLSAVVALTIPMAILQSSSTQNDLVVSFWLVCFVCFGIVSGRERKTLWTVLMACSLGLAVLTKGTAYIIAAPFLAWFLFRDAKNGWRGAGLKWLLAGCLVLALNFGHYQRNYSLFGNPLTSGTDAYSNSRVTFAVVASNLARNIGLHIWTPSHAADRHLLDAMAALHSVLGLQPDDPSTTWPGTYFNVPVLTLHEDLSGNPLHLLLFLFVALSLALRKNRDHLLLPHALSVLAGALLFCIMLRWQPWGSRLQLPLFVLFAPVAGVVASEWRAKWLAVGVGATLSLASLLWVLCNSSRPLVAWGPRQPYPPSLFSTTRVDQYFANNVGIKPLFVPAADLIKKEGFKNVGLRYESGDTWEYPLWALTRKSGLEGPRIEHVSVANASGTVPLQSFRPDVILSVSAEGEARLELPAPQ